MKKIVIDLQSVQRLGSARGVGLFSLALTKSLLQFTRTYDIHILINGTDPKSVEWVRSQLAPHLAPSQIHVWFPPQPTAFVVQQHHLIALSEHLYESFIQSLQPDILLITNFFDGYYDAHLTRLSPQPCPYRQVMIFYDLIPLLFPHDYLQQPSYKKFYLQKIAHLRQADALLLLSDSAAKDCRTELGSSCPPLCTITAALPRTDRLFAPLPPTASLEERNIDKPFLFTICPEEPRKNISGLLHAFLSAGEEITEHYLLAIASSSLLKEYKNIMRRYGKAAKSVRFLGRVTDTELSLLYRACTAFIFPSHYEGFGLPILEAMAFGKAVICGDNSSQVEIMDQEEARFDSHDVIAIQRKIRQVLLDSQYRTRLAQYGLHRSLDFSWEKVTTTLFTFLDHLPPQTPLSPPPDPVARAVNFFNHSPHRFGPKALRDTAICLSYFPSATGRKRAVFYDISELFVHDRATGIQRATNNWLQYLLDWPARDFHVFPIRMNSAGAFIHTALYGTDHRELDGSIAHFQPGDVLCCADLCLQQSKELLVFLRNLGVKITFVLYDLLPLHLPHYFPVKITTMFHGWLKVVTEVANQLICMSDTVAQEARAWLESTSSHRLLPLEIATIPFGSDFNNTDPTCQKTAEEIELIDRVQNSINFLMVGTLEPRKMHAQVLQAFEILWSKGHKVNLLLVGKQGWLIDRLVRTIETHPQYNHSLFWLNWITDSCLATMYKTASCLVIASEAEGYGLPIIEAAKYQLPIIARDLPIFQEVSHSHAFFFRGLDPHSLACRLEEWLALYRQGRHPTSDAIPLTSWKESTQALLQCLWR